MSKFNYIFVLLCFFSLADASAQDRNNGRVKIEDQYGNVRKGKMKQGEKTGEWKQYNSKGALVDITHYSEGKKNGMYTQYYSAGTIQWQGKYQDDKKEGRKMNGRAVRTSQTIPIRFTLQ